MSSELIVEQVESDNIIYDKLINDENENAFKGNFTI